MRWFLAGVFGVVSLSQVQAQMVQPADPHYNVVALRVEFSADTTRFTTGDGTFAGLDFPVAPKVDPLPHDAAYFRAHLAFLEHYTGVASAGRTTLSTYLIPEVIQLDKPMESYSPTGEDSESDPELAKLGRLVRDAWSRADQISTFDPAQLEQAETAFILFHAGVGRDIELIGTTLDKTPQDLPSIFMSPGLLGRFGVGQLNFKGMPVDHSMIIPRTETRSGLNSITDEPFLLELSINGLLAASFMSFLGVPDLFNTDTGESVIGPFGLMDPLGIFAYGGLFPPLPSAWTRTVLGWTNPRHIQDPGSYELMAGEVAKIEISEAEYFLLENRVRDPEGQGLALQVYRDGAISTQTIPVVREDFSRFNIEGFQGGVVTQASSYDFALPGWDSDGEQYNGGILIWHVDERQFAGTGNNDSRRLAVDIEEADGAQDIGFDGNVGAPFDFYFEGNPSSVELPSGRIIPLYENRFGPDTNPDSGTSGGGDSFLIMEDFSASGPVMSFSFRKSQDGAVADLGIVSLDVRVGAEGSISSVASHSAVFTRTEVIIPGIGQVNAQVRPAFGAGSLATIDMENGTAATFKHYSITGRRLELARSIVLPTQLSAAGPVVYHADAHYVQFTGTDQSEVLRIAESIDSYRLNETALGLVATDEGLYVFGQSRAGPLEAPPLWTYPASEDAGHPVMGRDRTGLWGAIPEPGAMLFLQPDGMVLRIDASVYFGEDLFSKSAAMADINQDGVLDIVTTAGSKLVAFSQGGALLPPFPIEIDAPATSAPLMYESGESVVVIVTATDGNIHAVDLGQGGELLAGFPLSAGFSLEATPLLSKDSLTVVTGSGILRSYGLNGIDRVLWSEKYGSPQNTSFVTLTAEVTEGESLLSAAETYNWPNPIRDGSTFFRCMTSEPSEVSVTVVNAAGSMIDRIHFTTSAGVPHEILWMTDAVSGVYYARVKARSISGATDSRLIKLAIIR